LIAEGAQDRHGNPISADQIKQILEQRLGDAFLRIHRNALVANAAVRAM
jgi:DNA-binding LytR/AlgR family response regulator